jgi:hypothetical protein
MISTSFITIASASAVGLVVISWPRRPQCAAGDRIYAVIASLLVAAALLYTFRPNVPCIRINETRLALR